MSGRFCWSHFLGQSQWQFTVMGETSPDHDRSSTVDNSRLDIPGHVSSISASPYSQQPSETCSRNLLSSDQCCRAIHHSRHLLWRSTQSYLAACSPAAHTGHQSRPTDSSSGPYNLFPEPKHLSGHRRRFKSVLLAKDSHLTRFVGLQSSLGEVFLGCPWLLHVFGRVCFWQKTSPAAAQ